ncbi:hypothetical protein B0A52_02281 [Exophiala mesophila]|uniref:Uncharacterized protein n=1 Tax=Exophiala mesophila TaxID=212818 RepID=A0A438NBJ7_EXOME|nr:hypothetical protein B0A52_02281 [Exophiala mesophila]
MYLEQLIWVLSITTTVYAKVIPVRDRQLLKRGNDWLDFTIPTLLPTATSTWLTGESSTTTSPWLTSESSMTTTTAVTISTMSSSSPPPFESISPEDYDDDDDNDNDMLVYLQEELYLLGPDMGIQFDCPDNELTLYFDEDLPINGTLQEWGETFESGVIIIPNDWVSYCGDISDWTLLGYSDPDVVFVDHDEEERYYEAINDPDMQFVVVVLHDLLNVNWLNRTITYEAYADDFRAVVGSLDTAPEEYDYFAPGPIGNASERNIDFYQPRNVRRDLPIAHQFSKRGIADIFGVVKSIPSLAKPTIQTIENTVILVNQGMKIMYINDMQQKTLDNAFNTPDVTVDLDLSKLPQMPGWEGFTYKLYQFYQDGKYWVELWRTRDPRVTITSSSPPFTTTNPPTTTITTTPGSTSSPSGPQATCAFRRDKEPRDRESGTWWKQLFKIDAEKLITTGDIPFPLKLLDIDGLKRAEAKAEEALSSASQILKRFTILSSSTTTSTEVSRTSAATLLERGAVDNLRPTPNPATAVAAPVGFITAAPQKRDAEPIWTDENDGLPGLGALDVAAPDLEKRQDSSDAGFLNGCDIDLLDWDLEFRFGENAATVFPPTLSFHNYTLKNRASIRMQCRDPFQRVKETAYVRIAAVPLGGCSTALRELEIDLFFVVHLSSVFTSGSNGSVTIDYSYSWNPISFDFELLGGGENGTIDLDAAKLGIGPPSTSGLTFDYVRATMDFPDLELGFALSPGLQVDVTTPLFNYTRGFMMGPAVNIVSNGTFSFGSGSRTSSSDLATTTTRDSLLPEWVDNFTDWVGATFQGSRVDVLTGLSWGVLWTDYTYQKLTGPLSSVFKIPASRTRMGWLFGPYKFWNRDLGDS